MLRVAGCALALAAFLVAIGEPVAAGVRPLPPNKLNVIDGAQATNPSTGAKPAGSPTSSGSEKGGGATRNRPYELRYLPFWGLCIKAAGPIRTDLGTMGASVPGCPGGSARAGARGAPAPPSPAEAALSAWWETTLPDPTMATSPPGGAITGLDLFLSIGGPQALSFDVTSLGIPVHIDVHSTYDVDWGDPRRTARRPDARSPEATARRAAPTRMATCATSTSCGAR